MDALFDDSIESLRKHHDDKIFTTFATIVPTAKHLLSPILVNSHAQYSVSRELIDLSFTIFDHELIERS